MTTAIICGSRDYVMHHTDISWLDALHETYKFTLVIEGGCRRKYKGMDLPTADLLGYQWARSRKITTATMDANWGEYGNAAGPIRNSAMAELGVTLNAIVIAFPGGRGTEDMCTKAEAKGLKIIRR